MVIQSFEHLLFLGIAILCIGIVYWVGFKVLFKTGRGHKVKAPYLSKALRTQYGSILYAEQAGKCRYCSRVLPRPYLEIDHIKPRARGGSNNLSNLQLLCGPCNKSKGAREVRTR